VSTRYQHGTIELKERTRGPAIWQFRWRDKTGTRLSAEFFRKLLDRRKESANLC